jgi:hypothetical protein
MTQNQALQYYMHDGSAAFRFELSGDLDAEGAHRLERDWYTASSVIGHRTLIVDMTFVTSADPDGRALLARWYADGAQLIAKSKSSRELAEAIVGERLPDFAGATEAKTWLPFRSGAAAMYLIAMLGTMLFPAQVRAANLKAETVAAWDDYVRSATCAMEGRLRPGSSFLWTSENPERLQMVRRGDIVAASAPGANPRRVIGGLIHHWIGAAFLPGVTLDDILEVTRDYDHYQVFYQPSVTESKTISRNTSHDLFSMVLMNKAFFLRTALDADYQVTNVRLDNRRFYSVSKTTRVQEIEGYGQPSEHRVPEGEGGGYIWKLFNIVRLEQRDGGVFIEMETLALSRDIPVMVRPLADPIVRRVSRNSILTSLQQTAEAVRGISIEAGRHADTPASAGHVNAAQTSVARKTTVFAQGQ